MESFNEKINPPANISRNTIPRRICSDVALSALSGDACSEKGTTPVYEKDPNSDTDSEHPMGST